ncbi:MAG: tRNA 2-thiouridine(34) synthase MnmA [Granulosicoccus sp.]|nr:tRNA 2-thiouridine(34) synthase MnmA [Granulosicoccus sp.]
MHVIVGMSGGVDSAVAALLLKQQGYQVSGLFMQNWEDDDEHCTARQDYRDASAVASQLRIELTTVNFADEYWQRVFAHFLDEYGAGRTPNPDILCNKEIKFKAFLDHARGLGADAIATGHYARCGGDSQNVCLLRGHDENKDQSYFLYTLGQQQLKPSIFPVGQLPKSDVRRLARDSGFHLHGKKDSTGICFIGERKFNRFLAEYLPAQPGRIVSEDGSVMGQHNGLMFYTLGQRQGLGIGGQQSASPAPWYVLAKNLKDNELVIGQGHDHPALLRTHLQAHDVHWVQGNAPSTRFNCTARVRYRQQDQDCRVQVDSKEKLNIHFVEPVRAATPGQSIVFYNGDTCLGGAIVSDFDQVPVNS